MNEPKRWLDDGAPEAVGQMLRAADNERPSPAALDQALAGVAVGAGILSSASGAAGASATLKGALLANSVFLKWSLIGALVTVGAGGLAVGFSAPFSSPHDEPVASPASSTPSGAKAPRAPGAEEQRGEPPAPSAPKAEPNLDDTPGTAPPGTAPPAAAPPAANARGTTDGRQARRPMEALKGASASAVDTGVVDVEVLAQETKLVDRARAELGAGQAAGALFTLDEYQTRFPRPRYAPEALYLRMEALLLLGKTQAARQVATRLAASHPSSPHAARAEAVLKTTIP